MEEKLQKGKNSTNNFQDYFHAVIIEKTAVVEKTNVTIFFLPAALIIIIAASKHSGFFVW